MKEINPDDFKRENLVLESDRVLVYSKIFCPLGCKYCFAGDLNDEGNSHSIYLSPEQLELLKKLPENINIIMLGCDTEFFLNEDEAIHTLENISVLGKDVSIITKLDLSNKMIKAIKNTSDLMRTSGNVLSFSMSIPCFESSVLWEPHAPSIEKRIETLKRISDNGISSLVAIRPLIPNISMLEIDKIIELTHSYVFGYYSGPLYVKDLNNGILNKEDIDNSKWVITQIQPDWMPEGNLFFKIENPDNMLYLKEVINRYGKQLFTGAAQGTDFIKKTRNEKF